MPDDHATAPGPDAATRAKREEFYGRIAGESLAPLWEVLKGLVPPEPRPTPRPYLWRYETVRPYLMEAGRLLTAEEAERRVLVLENPAFPGKSRATATLYAGIQLVMPGEVAPAHRHTASALRFVLESAGGHTAVGGERTTMRAGDFVITPSWAWHDHGNESGEPILWMDILDLPMVNFFESGFSEHHNDKAQSIGRPEGDALARYGAGLLPVEGGSPFGRTSPIFNYPFERTRAALASVAAAGSLDPHWSATLRYANPMDGGWAMPTIASWMTHVPAGTGTAALRSTDGIVVAVAEGRGVARIGDQRIPFGPQDIFVVPNWTWRAFEAEEDCFLFCSSDRVAQEKLGLWREERGQA
ncbi:gentisate 1,2-dioxygenase [Roseomonas sp. OT10]|uniref:gentisate 1,2-dioxygenase n=1 Tax=Roseomonas cutis TaxID=2897332 RepID=UPI001E559F81|nr:gentisate 1,2-dioxygenase [Roseomonas sp. OT10]UFN50279.1 gentisate 1,2-dioxygenase [Roseomonas sp. OT10]